LTRISGKLNPNPFVSPLTNKGCLLVSLLFPGSQNSTHDSRLSPFCSVSVIPQVALQEPLRLQCQNCCCCPLRWKSQRSSCSHLENWLLTLLLVFATGSMQTWLTVTWLATVNLIDNRLVHWNGIWNSLKILHQPSFLQ
jgi:hypothetical protein